MGDVGGDQNEQALCRGLAAAGQSHVRSPSGVATSPRGQFVSQEAQRVERVGGSGGRHVEGACFPEAAEGLLSCKNLEAVTWFLQHFPTGCLSLVGAGL